jgi:hypothetical protein
MEAMGTEDLDDGRTEERIMEVGTGHEGKKEFER